MFQFSAKGWGHLALTILLTSVAAEAAILEIYTDRATWQADLSALPTTYTFSGTQQNSTSAGITEGATSFVGFYNDGAPSYFTWRVNEATIAPDNPLFLTSFGSFMLGGLVTPQTGFTGGMLIVPQSGVTGLGFDFGAFALNAGNDAINNTSSTIFRINIFENGLLSQSVDVNGANRPNLAFFGVATSGNISGIQVLTNNLGPAGNTSFVVVDNYSFGQTALTSGGGDPPPSGGDPGTELPEPSTYAMAGLGLLTLVYFRRRATHI